MIASAMVGRQQESRIVEERIKQLLNGRGGVLNIEGTAGIGKSRLIREIMALEITRNVLFLEGRALSEGKNLSFHPIIQVIKAWSDITEKDNPTLSYQKLSGNINRIYPEQAPEIIPFLATMMGYSLEAEARQRIRGIEGEALEKLILKSVRDLLSRTATLSPVVILIEDAHWSDQSTISFLESLFKLVKNHRLLFINVFRPGYKETGDRLKTVVKENLPDHYREIVIKPLDAKESEELINNLMNRTNLPDDIRNLIISRSEGNPFFIEEVIRSFIDEGLVEVGENGFTVTGQIQYANIPETIDKVILSRIERLDEKTKNLLKTASVIGRNFYYKVLEEATQAIEELDSRLEYLKEAQLLNEHRHKEDVEFLFKHALAQQATYDSILQRTRKELHLKIARSIEKVFAEKIHEFYGILALHYGKAEVREKMEEYLVKAGDEAFQTGASSEALNYYMEAFKSLLPDPKNEDDIHKYNELEIKIGFAQEAAGNNIEAIESFKRILSKNFRYDFPASDFMNELRGLGGMLGVFIKLNLEPLFFRKVPDERFNTFMKIATQMEEALTSLNPRMLFFHASYFINTMANYDLSRSVPGLSFFTEGIAVFLWTGLSFRMSKKMIGYARRAGAENNPNSLIDFRFIQTMYNLYMGHLEEDRDFEQVYQTGMRVGDFWPTAIYTLYSAMLSTERGHYNRVKELINKLEEVSESFDNSHAKAQSFRLSTWAYYKFRKLDLTLEIADEGVTYTGKTGHFSMLLLIWCAKSLAHSAKNELEEAKKAFSEAEKLIADRKIMTGFHVPYVMARTQITLADLRSCIALHKPHREKFRAALGTINDLIRLSKKMRCEYVEAYRLKAQLYWMMKKHRIAFRYLTLSIQAGQKYNALLELSRSYLEAGKCLRESGTTRSSLLGLSSSEYLLKARTLFGEMDLQWDLQEYERYMEG